LTRTEKNIKRLFDISFSFFLLLILGWFILLLGVVSKIFIGGNGFFLQKRVGQNGRLFTIYKIETIPPEKGSVKKRVTPKLGRFMQKIKIDELPQVLNVFRGAMSFVGPRPDLPGFADQLIGKQRIILKVKPGITGPATLLYRDERILLEKQENPDKYNKEVIWPQKITINMKYVEEYSFIMDMYYIYKTFIS